MNKNVEIAFKTGFNYCSTRGGQNSVIPVVSDVPEKIFTHNMLHYHITDKSIALNDYCDLNMSKIKMFVNALAEN